VCSVESGEASLVRDRAGLETSWQEWFVGVRPDSVGRGVERQEWWGEIC
jgi:hypothetical protein